MKKLLSLLLASLMVVSTFSVSAFASEPQEEKKLTVVSLGDSNATGYNTEDFMTQWTENPVDYRKTAAAHLLADKLGANIIDYSFEGNTAAEFKNQFDEKMLIRYYDWTTNTWPWMEIDNSVRRNDIANADIVTMSIGGMDLFYDSAEDGWGDFSQIFKIDPNDIIGSLKNLYTTLKNIPGSVNESTTNVAENLGIAFKKARELNPDGVLLYSNAFNPYENIDASILGLELKEITRIVIATLNAKVAIKALENGVLITDVHGVFMKHSEEGVIIKACDTLQDFINYNYIEDPHPTKRGHQLIADAYYKTLVVTGSLPTAYGYTAVDGTLLPDTLVFDADADFSAIPTELVIKTTKGDYTVEVAEWKADKEIVAGVADTYILTAVIDNMPKFIVNPPEIKLTVKAFYEPELLKGDANGDGIVNNKDVTAIAHHIRTNGAYYIITENADMNNDGKINTRDIVWLLGYIRASK